MPKYNQIEIQQIILDYYDEHRKNPDAIHSMYEQLNELAFNYLTIVLDNSKHPEETTKILLNLKSTLQFILTFKYNPSNQQLEDLFIPLTNKIKEIQNANN